MRKYVFLTLLAFLSYSVVSAQCESCSVPEGVIVHHCYQDATQDGKCAMFTENSASFYFEDSNRKKSKVVQVNLPADMATPSIAYLSRLADEKKLRMSTADILFLADALQSWYEVEALRMWKQEMIGQNYTILPSGLAYKVLTEGKGNTPTTGQQAKVHYTGYLIDGKKFDSSLDRQQPFVFPLGKGRVIKGWDEGVALMRPGSRYLFRIPPELGYGSRGAGGAIPPNAVLFFDVRFLDAK